MKGFRTPPQGSKNDILRGMQVELQNNQMAIKMSQMLLKRMLEDNSNMGKDLGAALAQITEMQYKFAALVSTLKLDPEQVAETANVQRLADFDKAASEEDAREELLVADTVTSDSTITITSTTEDGSGIFRSRIKLADAGVPALTKGLMGQPVGTKLDIDIAGKVHNVELLSIRNPVVVVVDTVTITVPQLGHETTVPLN